MSGGSALRARARQVVPPLVLLAHALAFVAALALLHALGARDAVSILSGTAPAEHAPNLANTFLGVGYVLAWFATVVLGPVLVLAAALHVVLHRLTGGVAFDSRSVTAKSQVQSRL